MALTKDIQIKDTSTTIANCYINFSRIDLTIDQQVTLYVQFFSSEADRRNSKSNILSAIYSINVAGESSAFNEFFSRERLFETAGNNIVKNSYTYLKTLAEFSGAQDC